MTTAKHNVKFSSGRRAKQVEKATRETAPARIPRITKIMALAIRFDHLIKTGQVKDQAELARLGHVSRARLSQIMDLLLLAPDIQEELLVAEVGCAIVHERELRIIALLHNWKPQRRLWTEIAAKS